MSSAVNAAHDDPGLLAVRYALQRDEFTLRTDLCILMRGITGMFGPSGAGKTTLLRCIAGLERSASGRLSMNGKVLVDSNAGRYVPANRRDVGYVFQEPRLFPHLSVRGNLEYGYKRARGERRVGFDNVVELLALSGFLERRSAGLSGGEAQRVAIGRALLRSPSLLLMDEPLASLDAAHKYEVLPFIERLQAELSIPVIYVSHNIDEICFLCDQLIVLNKGEVIANGELQAVLARTDLPVLAGEEAGSVVQGTAMSYDDDYALTQVSVSGGELQVPGRFASSSSLRLRIRANDISLCRERPQQSSILNLLPATVDDIQDDAPHSALVHLRSGGDHLIARVTRRSVAELRLRTGDEIIAQIKSMSVRMPVSR